MPVPVQCDQCQAKYLIEDRFAGKRAKCKRCGHIMSIPLAEPDVVELDDTMESDASASAETSPWSGRVPPPPPPRGSYPQGVTSQPPRGWRPQDVVVEREGEVEDIPLSSPFPTYVRPRAQVGPTIDWLVPALLVAFVGGLIAFGVTAQRALRERASDEQWEAVGGQVTAYTWGYVGFLLIGLFLLAGPVTLACVAAGAKIRKLGLPGSAYARACAVAAVPALAIVLVALGAANRMVDASAAMLILMLSVPVAFLVLRFAFGFDWLSSGIAFGLAAVFGGAAVFANNHLSQKAAEAAFLRKDEAKLAQANSRRPTPGGSSSAAPSDVPAPPPAPAPAPADTPPPPPQMSNAPDVPPPPAAGETRRRTSEYNLRLLGGALNAHYAANNNTWPRDLAAAQATGLVEAENLKSPFGPASGGADYAYTPGPPNSAAAADLVLAYDRAEYEKGTGATVLFANMTTRWLDKANVDRALARSSEVAAQYAAQPTRAVAANGPPGVNASPPSPNAPPGVANSAIQKDAVSAFAEKIRAAAGEIVTAVDVVPLDRGVTAVVRPLTPSQAVAVVRSGAAEDAIEVWVGADGAPPKKTAQLQFKGEPALRASYGLSADGQRLVRVASFPKLSVRAVAVADARELASVDLNEKLGTPTVLGFLAGERVLVRWEKFGKYGVEVVDLKLRRVVRQIDLPEHDGSPGNEAVSPDGRYFVTTGRGKFRGELINQLVLHTTFEGGVPRRFPTNALGGRATIKTAGIAFSPDGTKVAALFTEAGNGVVVAWTLKTGKPLSENGIVVPGNVTPLAPPLRAGHVGGPAFGNAPLAGGGVAAAGAGTGRSLSWLGNGAWLVAASQVLDASDGRLIGELGITGALDQVPAGDQAVYLPFREPTGASGVAVIKFNPKSLPAAPAGPAKPAASASAR